jgi:hypothetical protein
MITIGVILLLIGLLVGVPLATTLGLVLLVAGLVLNLVPIGGTTHRYY